MLTVYIQHSVPVPSFHVVLTRVSSSDSESVIVCTSCKICHCPRECEVVITLIIYLSVVSCPSDISGRTSSGDTG